MGSLEWGESSLKSFVPWVWRSRKVNGLLPLGVGHELVRPTAPPRQSTRGLQLQQRIIEFLIGRSSKSSEDVAREASSGIGVDRKTSRSNKGKMKLMLLEWRVWVVPVTAFQTPLTYAITSVANSTSTLRIHETPTTAVTSAYIHIHVSDQIIHHIVVTRAHICI